MAAERRRSRSRILNLQLQKRAPGGSPLVQAYLSEDESVAGYFSGSPHKLQSYRDKAAEVDGRFDADARRAALGALRLGPVWDEARVADWVERGLAVTTGQQPGLFGGPLYSVYKALGALRLARRLEAELDRPVMPIFWVADEDHDWAEADHTYLLDRENELHRIQVPDPGAAGRALHRVPLGAELGETLEQFIALLPQSDFSAPFFEVLRGAYAEGATLGSGFTALMESLLGPLGIAVTEAGNPALKELSMPVLERELDSGADFEPALQERATALEAAGYGVQVTVMEGGLNVFLEGEGGRERVYGTEGGYRLSVSGEELDRAGVAARIEADARCISPNVFLRPVVESSVFPTVSYVAGPGEMAYYAQLSPLFEGHGIRMPIIAPRPAFTALEAKIAKVLEKFGLGVDGVAKPFHELASEIARDEVPAEVKQAIGKLRGAIAGGVGDLVKATKAIDPTLKKPVEQVRNAAFKELGEVEKKITQSLKRENEIALAQLEKAQRNLFPDGKPQERILNPHYYLARYGNSFLEALVEEIEIQLD